MTSKSYISVSTEQQQRVSHAKDFMEMMKNDPDFVDSIITSDESRCFAFDPLINGKIWLGWFKIIMCKKTLLPKVENQSNANPAFPIEMSGAQRIYSGRPNSH